VVKEIVVISGKGGTGKTSVVASFAALAENKIVADCDVDAADLYLVLEPQIEHREDFSGGKVARISPEDCESCGRCEELCRFEAVGRPEGENGYRIDPISCEGCGVCMRACPAQAIALEPVVNGEWFISRTRHGPMVHGRLGIAEENSGKMVSLIRNQAKRLAREQNRDLLIVDGSPGIGCPVIASVTGADLALIVTEPTLSGLHDLQRVIETTRHFEVPTAVCVNKWDLNPELADRIEREAQSQDLAVVGRIRYDVTVVKAQIEGQSAVEYANGPLAADFRALWEAVAHHA
jgi:MinD superfamily P-loop ATPase